MLTKSDLALIRAALLFFDEEMSPHGIEVMRPYFDETPVREFVDGEIRRLRDCLQSCTLAYVGCDPATMTLATTEPFLDLEVSNPEHQSAEIATILFPSPR